MFSIRISYRSKTQKAYTLTHMIYRFHFRIAIPLPDGSARCLTADCCDLRVYATSEKCFVCLEAWPLRFLNPGLHGRKHPARGTKSDDPLFLCYKYLVTPTRECVSATSLNHAEPRQALSNARHPLSSERSLHVSFIFQIRVRSASRQTMFEEDTVRHFVHFSQRCAAD